MKCFILTKVNYYFCTTIYNYDDLLIGSFTKDIVYMFCMYSTDIKWKKTELVLLVVVCAMQMLNSVGEKNTTVWNASFGLTCCCCSPSETYGRKRGDSNFQILAVYSFPVSTTGGWSRWNILLCFIYIYIYFLFIYIYHSEHYGLSFLDLTDVCFLQGLPLCVYYGSYVELTLRRCVIYIWCVGFASLDVIYDELNDCA